VSDALDTGSVGLEALLIRTAEISERGALRLELAISKAAFHA